MDETIEVILLKDGRTLISKVEALTPTEIGHPDCLLIDPVLYNGEEPLEKALTRFPGAHLTDDNQMRMHSDFILTMVTPTNKLLSEYLVAIG